jgi:four helix bundle protein
MADYKNLIAWQKAMDLVETVYKVTETFPKREVYGLTDQIRRAAVSIPSNIAEGQAHYSNREFTHYLRHSRGCLAEIETQMLIAMRLGYISESAAEKILKQLDELSRILSGLINSLQSKRMTVSPTLPYIDCHYVLSDQRFPSGYAQPTPRASVLGTRYPGLETRDSRLGTHKP